jgi:C1q domain
VMFQDGFSTRAMLGTLGDDNFAIKVSPNGSSFFSALSIDRSSGHVGLNGYAADSNNGLGVKGTAFLFDAEADHCRFTFNKQGVGSDAALTFQSGYSARALIGLLGNEHFTFKVSPDAVAFRTALTIDNTSGQVSLEQSPKFLAYLNFDKYCAANTFTKIQFNNARHNDQSAFDAAGNQFVVPVAGYYLLGFRVMFKANAAVPASVTATIYKNGAELLDDTRVQTSGTVVSNRTMLQSQTLLKLAAGDTIAVWAMMETSDGYIAAAQNSFYGHRIA